MRIISIVLVLSIISVSAVFCENLLKNPGMEESDSSTPGWILDEYTRNGSLITIEKGDAHSGNNSVSIENIQPNDTRLVQSVKVKEKTNYKISGWIKTKDVSFEGLGANLSFNDHWFTTEEIEGTQNQWRYVEFFLSVLKDISVMHFCLRLGGYGGISTGKAFFDDVAMEEVADVPGGSNTFTIGTSKDDTGTREENVYSESEPEPDTEYTQPVDTTEVVSKVIVFILIGLSVVVFCIQLIIVKPKKEE